MSTSLRLLLLSCGLIACCCQPATVYSQTFTERITTSNQLSRPVFVTAPTGDSDRIFITEQHTGRIEILDRNTGNLLNTPFLDLSGLATGNEQGLLGLAFDPDYATNGFFYVNVTTSADGGDTHIRRYKVVGDPLTSNTADPASAFELLSYNQPQSNHNGGWIGFGPNDGYLYIASGDGGNGNDVGSGHTANIGNAQDITNNRLGKMLRIDVDGDDFPLDSNNNYAIPPDNPFVGNEGDDELWAFGLRNPYRSSFDRETGDLWIGDVGQGAREEIDFQPADSPGGENYGWRLREGTIQTPSGVGGDPPPGHVGPIYDYERGSDPLEGNVVIGGYVYRGPVAAFQGHYFFADGASHNIWKLDPDAVIPRASVRRVNDQLLPDNGSISFIGSFGEDADGNLYIAEVFGNEIFRVATSSQSAVWNGDDATAGAAGDGNNWSDANNWTRGGNADQGFVAHDAVLFGAGSSQTVVNLGEDQTVAAVAFEASYTLQENTLRVLSGNVTVNEGITATLTSNLEAETADHSLRKQGAGTLQIDGTAGQVVVKEGTLSGNGAVEYLTVQDGATVAPGASAGTLEVANALTLSDGSTLEIELGGTEIEEFDRLIVGGGILLNGTLDVRLINDFVPQAGDNFGFIVNRGGAGGSFDMLDLPELDPNLEWLLNPDGAAVSLLVNSTLEADFDNDGDVDADDLSAWQSNQGVAGGAVRSQGDADGDLDVDGADFLLWQRQFSGNASESPQAAVPEPQSLLLFATCLLGIVAHRFDRYFFSF